MGLTAKFLVFKAESSAQHVHEVVLKEYLVLENSDGYKPLRLAEKSKAFGILPEHCPTSNNIYSKEALQPNKHKCCNFCRCVTHSQSHKPSHLFLAVKSELMEEEFHIFLVTDAKPLCINTHDPSHLPIGIS